MKKITMTLILSVFIGTVSGQINVGTNELARKNAGDFNKEHLDRLKSSKTLFISRRRRRNIR